MPTWRGALDNGVLDDLGPPGTQLAWRHCSQEIGIDDDHRWLIKGPDQVLACCVVYSGLASNTAVDRGQEARRHLRKADTAQRRRGQEPREITHDSAPKRDDQVAAFDTVTQEPVIELACCRETHAPLACGDEIGRRSYRGILQSAFNRTNMQRADIGVRNDPSARRLWPAFPDAHAGTRQRAGSDIYVRGS